MVPTFTADRSTGEAPSFSPAASPWVRRSPSLWPPCRSHSSATRSRPSRTHPGVRCDPAHIHQVGAGSGLEGVRPLVPATRTPSRLACRTRAVWQCRPVPSLSGLLPPSPATPGSGCPQLHQAAATAQGRGPFHPLTVKQRLVAHRANPVESAVPSACGVGCSYDYSRRYSCEPCWVQERRLHARCRSSWRSVELSLLGSSWTTADLLYGKASRTGRNLAYAAPGRLPFLVNG